MAINVFLSTVSDEFRAYRDQLVHDLTRQNVAVKVQEDFKDLGGKTLAKLDAYIADCDAVVHLVGDMCGAAADEWQQRALIAKDSNFLTKLPPLGEALKQGVCLPYTQWEAWLALYHNKALLIAKAKTAAPRGPNFAPSDASRAAQAAHLTRLKALHRYPGSDFGSPDELARQIAYTAILDLLVADYAQKEVRERDVAEGFIREMAKRVAGDKALDLDGMKQAVRNAIDIYENEIAGRPIETNFDEIVSRALASAKVQVDKGQSALARETLRRAAEGMQREEAERRERYAWGVSALYTQARDIALAAYDGDAAAGAILELARAIHGTNALKITDLLNSEANSLYAYGADRGSNVHLVASIALRYEQLALVVSGDERSAAQNGLAAALLVLGDREKGTSRLEEAVRIYRAALERLTPESAPLDWATIQTNLGIALFRLGERESGTVRLEEAVDAYHETFKVQMGERAPFEWATTLNNLGAALETLGVRERGTKRLEQAIAVYRGVLKVWTRERAPLEWALAQNNLGNALHGLGEDGSGIERFEEAVEALLAALEERTRQRVPLDWAATQHNLGLVLATLGRREGGTAQLEEAVAAFRAALEERTRERVPRDWATTQKCLGDTLRLLGDRERGTARLEESIAAYRTALQERGRDRVPLDWAKTQRSLGDALRALGEREGGAARLEEAVAACRSALLQFTREQNPRDWAKTHAYLGSALMRLGQRENVTTRFAEASGAYREALKELTREQVPLDWAVAQNNLGFVLLNLGRRETGTAMLEEAVATYRAALEERTRERAPLEWAVTFGNQGVAMMLIADRNNDFALVGAAVTQIATAYETLRDGGHKQGAADFREQLTHAQAILDRLKAK